MSVGARFWGLADHLPSANGACDQANRRTQAYQAQVEQKKWETVLASSVQAVHNRSTAGQASSSTRALENYVAFTG
jgi:hypothetical protein